MANPKIRFKQKNGENYPDLITKTMSDVMEERHVLKTITDDSPLLSFTIEQGVIYPEDKKTNKRDFLIKDKDNKKFALTEIDDIIYNPANIKFGAIHKNSLCRGVVSPIYAIFKVKEDPTYMEAYVQRKSFIAYSMKYLEGTVEKLKTLKPNDFLKLNVTIPCIEEQKRIADFLDELNIAIECIEKENSYIEKMKTALIQKVFKQEIKFKKEDGSDYPNWEIKKVKDVATVYDGVHQTPEYVSSGIKFASVENIDNPFMTEKFITKDAFEKNFKNKAQKGDVLLTRIGTIGKAYYIDNDEELAYYVSLALLKCSKKISGKYLKHLISSSFFQRSMWERTLHEAYPKKINKGDIGDCEVLLPCIEEQEKIAEFLDSMDELIFESKQELKKYKEMKKGLLQQMFI